MFKCQFLNVVKRTTGKRSICVKEIGDLSQVQISMGSLILSCGQPNFLPACRRLLFPLLHACNKGNRRRLHAGNPIFSLCHYQSVTTATAAVECWCRQMRVQHQPGLKGGGGGATSTSPHTHHPATVYQLHEGWRESNYLALPFAVSISPVQDNQSSLLLLGEDRPWTIKPCVGLQNEPRSKVWKT